MANAGSQSPQRECSSEATGLDGGLDDAWSFGNYQAEKDLETAQALAASTPPPFLSDGGFGQPLQADPVLQPSFDQHAAASYAGSGLLDLQPSTQFWNDESALADPNAFVNSMEIPEEEGIALQGFDEQPIAASSTMDPTVALFEDPHLFSMPPVLTQNFAPLPALFEAQLGFMPDANPDVPSVGLPATNADAPLSCPQGCPGTFKRSGDYRRHMKKHSTPRFKCAVFDCPKIFYRADKLRDHYRQGHKDMSQALLYH